MKKTIAIMIALIMVLVSGISVFADENSQKTNPEFPFTNRTNPDNGGAIYWDGNESPIDVPFTKNTAPNNGGAIYFD